MALLCSVAVRQKASTNRTVELEAPFTQDAEHLATTHTQIIEHTAVNASVHTDGTQHQRILCANLYANVLPRPV